MTIHLREWTGSLIGDYMKFWELTSILSGEKGPLEATLKMKRWRKYDEWYQNFPQLVREQDRVKLDAILPESLVKTALREANLKYYVDEISDPSGTILRSRRANDKDIELSALPAYEKYGAVAIEDALEKGSTKV
jgi:hypothetical protein